MDIKDLATLTVASLAPALPYLADVAKGAAGALGKQITETALVRGQKIWEWLTKQAPAQPGLPETLEKLRASPDDADIQGSVRLQLRELLAKDPAAPAALQTLLQEIGVMQTSIQQSGQGNIAAARDITVDKLTQNFNK